MNTPQQNAAFTRFVPKQKDAAQRADYNQKTAVIYTRVSTKEQADKNLSLDFQYKMITTYAQQYGFAVLGVFGGTYESAKTDGRREFKRMLDTVKNSRGAISHILVYSVDRFSRTGGAAIQLETELQEKYGVSVLAVTQPMDTRTPTGKLNQNMALLYSEFDNAQRRQRTMAGTKEKVERGIWCSNVPLGYERVRKNGVTQIIANESGKKIRKAFEWKAAGWKIEAIVAKLKHMGIPMYKQKLSKILSNPFYCGIIIHRSLNGRIVEGTHEKLISKELFLQVNGIREQQASPGVPHLKERDEVPLKVFVKCSRCHQPFTGYEVKAKGLWYYKCRTTGCRCNKSAKQLHALFEQKLNEFVLRPNLLAPLKVILQRAIQEQTKSRTEELHTYQQQLAAVEKKLENLQEKYYVDEKISEEIFEKLSAKLTAEQHALSKEIAGCGNPSSNHEETIEKVLQIASKLPSLWASSPVGHKERLQKLVFPEGIYYDGEKGVVRTEKTNSIFALMSSVARACGQNKKGPNASENVWSLLAGRNSFKLILSHFHEPTYFRAGGQ